MWSGKREREEKKVELEDQETGSRKMIKTG